MANILIPQQDWAKKALRLPEQVVQKIPRSMKLSMLMLVCSAGIAWSVESYAQEAKVSLNAQNETVQMVLNKIEDQSEFSFFFNVRHIDLDRRVSLQAEKSDVFVVLDKLFAGTDVTYKVLDRKIILTKGEASQQNGRRVTGKVLDKSGEPIIGANVVVKGTTTGTVTDIDGNFSLEVAEGALLEISYIGYLEQEIKVGNQNNLTIRLSEDTQNLDEVVVTALGIKREEKALGYAVQKVGGENFSTVKPVNIATTLTGKVAGLNILNSTEFNSAPTLSLRGDSPLLVIDGVPYANVTLNDISADDIESVDVLKGATASALYGSRGGAGAVMITTKRGQQEGLSVTVNSSTMFNAGYLKKPEVQTVYSSGSGGTYRTGDFVWGDRLDIGHTAVQYDPVTHEWHEQPLVSKGKDNLKNFQQLSLVTNNNVNITQKGKYGSVRTSLTHVYNKGQFPNQKLNKVTYSVSGEMKWKDFSFDGGLTYNKRIVPNDMGTGYGASGFLYNLLIWTGTEYDIRDYKDYWVKPGEQQNWMDNSWYDNPYVTANEITHTTDYDLVNGYFNMGYNFTPWLKLQVRSGLDSYSMKEEWQNPINACGGWNKRGYYALQRAGGYSLNNDAILTADHKFGDFSVDGFIGGSVYYWKKDQILGETQNGLQIPEYYSLKGSADPAKVSSGIRKSLTNSIYAKASVAWKSALFLDVTARNDWSSTLPQETRSYFYPSVAGSVVLSEFIPMPEIFDFWKIRASWTQTKQALDVYDTNAAYSISNNLFNGTTAAYYPTSIRGIDVKPSATRSYEVGTAFNLFKNRLKIDFTYYNKLYYNLTRYAPISDASGFGSTLINIDEEQIRKGYEITLSGDIIRGKDWNWSSAFNWARDRYYYHQIDPVYSTQQPWVAAGKRWDWYGTYDYERDPEGNIIHEAGYPVISKYESVAGYSNPDWIWGWTNTVSYKNFTLSFTFDGRVGGVTHDRISQALWNSGAHIDSDNQYRYDEVVNGKITYVGQGVKVVSGSVDYDAYGNIVRDDRVFAPNDVAVSYETYMLSINPFIGNPRSQHIIDQTFFKLRDLSVTYKMPQFVCEKINLKGASVAFVGQNLLIWTKEFRFSDPDSGTENINSPSCRYLGFNVKLDF